MPKRMFQNFKKYIKNMSRILEEMLKNRQSDRANITHGNIEVVKHGDYEVVFIKTDMDKYAEEQQWREELNKPLPKITVTDPIKYEKVFEEVKLTKKGLPDRRFKINKNK